MKETKPKLDPAIAAGRTFMKSPDWESPSPSDQELKKPQPPLFHSPKNEKTLALPRDFSKLNLQANLAQLLNDRKSRRIYSQDKLSIDELAFLLYAAQGVKGRRGKAYASLRTVPSGGARHGFELYLDVRLVEGLEPGLYHYLAQDHSLEYVGPAREDQRLASLSGQTWACQAGVIFYLSAVAYRFEWRYHSFAHRIALIDLGHIGQSLYLAAEALNLGTCGIGAYDQAICDSLFNLDGEEEFIVYAQPVGKVSEQGNSEESIFYGFVQEEGL